MTEAVSVLRCVDVCSPGVHSPVPNLSAEEQGPGCGTGLCGLKENTTVKQLLMHFLSRAPCTAEG